jgi:biopolymer transport protein ExbB
MSAVGNSRSRLLRFFLACLLVTFVLGTVSVSPAPALAQEGAPKPEGEPGKGEKEQPSLFTHIIDSAGWFFGPLLLLVSICLVTLIVLLAMDLRLGATIPPAFVDEFTDLVNKRQFKQAFELCRSDNSFLARVMTAGMGRLQYGIEDAREASRDQVESVKAGKEQLINYLGTIGTLGPMIGLVGTVFGMILAFRRIAGSTTAPKADELAGDISHALVVTLLGIALSVPAIFCYAFFNNRLKRLALDSGNLADDLLTQMYHNSKKAAATPAAAVPAAPTVPPTPTARADQRGIRPSE